MRKINWGIIGLGAIAQKFSEAFADTKNSKLLAVASHDYQTFFVCVEYVP